MTKSNSRTKNSVLNLTASMGGELLTTLLKFVVRTVFIHTLGKAYLGINGLFADLLTMLSLTELGFDTAINFKLYKPLAEGDDKRVRVLMKFYRQAYRVVGTAILLLGLCLIPALPLLIRDYDSLEGLGINAVLIFLLFLFRTVSSYWFFAYRSAVMKAAQKKYVLDLAGYVITIVANVAKILVLVLFRSFVLYTATMMVFTIVQNYVFAAISKRYLPQYFEKEEDKITRREVVETIKDCMALFVYKVNTVVLKATDNVVISSFIGLAAVGMYSNYFLFYITVNNLLDKTYAAIKSSIGNLFATETVEKKYAFFQVMNYLTVLAYGTAGVGIAVCGNELIRVWVGSDYVITQPFAILIGVEILFHGLCVHLDEIRNVSGVFRPVWYRPVIGVVLNIGLSIWLVNVCGIYGVIIGTLVSEIFSNFVVDPTVVHRYSFENYRSVWVYYRRNICYCAVLCAVTAADIWLCSRFFVGHGWLSVIVHILIVALTVPGALVLLWWRSAECRYLTDLAKRILKNVRKRLG